jgi:hypothetical protein
LHLAPRGLDRRLAGVDVPLRQREHARAVGRAPGRHDHGDLIAAHEHATRRDLALARDLAAA